MLILLGEYIFSKKFEIFPDNQLTISFSKQYIFYSNKPIFKTQIFKNLQLTR